MTSEKKGSGEHPAVIAFKQAAAELRNVVIPAAESANRRAESILSEAPPPSVDAPAPTSEPLAGAYVITIQAKGPHHNLRETDANRLLARFVRELRNAGHEVTHASFKNGSEESLHDDPDALASTPTTPRGENR